MGATLKDMYNALRKDGRFTEDKDFGTFAKKMNERGYSSMVYNTVRNAGANVPDIATFRKNLGIHVWKQGEGKKNVRVKPTSAVGMAAQSVGVERWGGTAPTSQTAEQPNDTATASAPTSISRPTNENSSFMSPNEKVSALVKGLREGREATDEDVDYLARLPQYGSREFAQQNWDKMKRQQQKMGEAVEKAGREYTHEEERRLNQPIVNTGNEGANRYIVKTQGQLEKEIDDSAKRVVGDKSVSDYLSNAIFGEFKEADKRASQITSGLSGAGTPGSEMGVGIARTMLENQQRDPELLLKRLQEKTQNAIGKLFSTPNMRAQIEEEARHLGMPVDGYIQNALVPKLQERLSEEFDKAQLERYLPKSTLGYIMSGVNDSLTGTLLQMATMNRSQREYMQRANAMTAEGLNPNVEKPGVWANAAKGAVGFAADAPVFRSLSPVGGVVAGKVLGNGVQMTARMANASWYGRMGVMAGQGAISQGTTGFLYGGLNSAVQNFSTGEDTSIANTVRVAFSGALSEGASWGTMGAFGGVVGGGLYNIGWKGNGKNLFRNGMAKVGSDVLKIGSEGLGMHLGGNVANMVRGEDTDWFSAEGVLEDCANVVALKLSHAHKLLGNVAGVGREKGADGKRESYKDFVLKNMSQYFSSDAAKGARFKFTEEEMSELFNAGYVPDRKKYLVGYDKNDNAEYRLKGLVHWTLRTKGKKPTDRDKAYDDTDAAIKTIYDRIMSDENISWDTKAKYNALVMGTAPSVRPMMDSWSVSSNGDKKVVEERAKDGTLLSRTTYDTEDARDAIAFRLLQNKEQQRLNNAFSGLLLKDFDNKEIQEAYMRSLGYDFEHPENPRNKVIEESMAKAREDYEKGEWSEEGANNIYKDWIDFVYDNGALRGIEKDFLEERRMHPFDLYDILHKEPWERTDEEQQILLDYRRALESKLFPEDAVHEEQSQQMGKDVAEENGLGSETPNGEAVKSTLAELSEAEQGVRELMDANEVFASEYKRLQEAGLSNAQIYQELINGGMTQEELAPFAKYINANSKVQGMVQGTQQEIERTAEKRVSDWGYRGALNGEKQSGENIVYVTDDKGRLLVVASGDVAFDSKGNAKEDVGDMLVVYDTATGEMDFVSAKDVKFHSTERAEEYKKGFIQHLQELNSQAYVEAQQGEEANGGKPSDTSLSPTEPLEGEGNKPEQTGTTAGGNSIVNDGKGGVDKNGNILNSDGSVNTEGVTNNHELAFKDGTPVPMTTDSKGRPTADYSKMSAEQGAEWISTQFGDKAEAVVDGKIERAKKELAKAEKMKVDYSGEEADIMEAEAKKSAAMDAANKELALYTDIKKVLTEQKVRATMEAAKSDVDDASENSAGLSLAREKFESGQHVVGYKRTRTLADGSRLKGHYELVEAESLTASHDANNGYRKSDGFPVNEEGRTVNDRDYENDKDAQRVTDQIARHYDGQAVDQTPVVTKDGIVMDGNGRTMAGQKAAKDGTDGAYIEALKEDAESFGFTAEQIDGMKHPRLVFVADEPMSYDTATFAKFNKNERKSQGNTHQAIANTKKLTAEDVSVIVSEMEGSGSLDAFFNNPSAINALLKRLIDNGVIGLNEVAGLREGEDKLSAAGKDFVKNLLLGSVFSEDTIRMMGADAGLKSKALNGIRAVLDNMKLGEYALGEEIDKAMQLMYEARQMGGGVDALLRTPSLLEENAADRYDPISQAIALALDGKAEDFRELMLAYNRNVEHYTDANQLEMFGERPTKEEFINEFLKLRKWKNYETRHSEKEGAGDAGGTKGSEQETRGGNEAETQEQISEAVKNVATEITKRVGEDLVVTDEGEAEQRLSEEGSGDSQLKFSKRERPAPTKTQKVYKLMRLGDDGKLYPLFIDSTAPTELGVWYDADSPDLSMLREVDSGVHLVNAKTGEVVSYAKFYSEHPELFKGKQSKYPSKEALKWAADRGMRFVYIEDTERGQKRFGGENRRYWNLGLNGSGAVALFSMRPGWHAGSLPTMRQIGKGKEKNLRDDRFVWVEGEVSADKDYTTEAEQNPDKDLPDRIPEDGYYMKATNADKTKSQADRVGWYVAGAFKANRIMSDREARSVIDKWNEEHPDKPVEYDYERESGKEFNAETMRLEDVEGRASKERKEFRTKDGEVYGFTDGQKIYLDTKKMKPETPLHEYTHLWGAALRRVNAEEWENVKGLLDKVDGLKEEIQKLYPELKGDDLYDEMLAMFSGREGAKKLEDVCRKLAAEEGKSVTDSAKEQGFIDRVRTALQTFWKGVADLLHVKFTTAEEVADKVLADWARGYDPRKKEEHKKEESKDKDKKSVWEKIAELTKMTPEQLEAEEKRNREEYEAEKREAILKKYEAIRENFKDKKDNEYADVLRESSSPKEAASKFRKMAAEKRAVAADWRSRVYKKNDTAIASHDIYGEKKTTSINAANERRREAAIKNALQAAEEYDDFADTILRACGLSKDTVPVIKDGNLRLQKADVEEVEATAKEYGVDATWLARYVEGMREKNSAAAWRALHDMKALYLREHTAEKKALMEREGVNGLIANKRLFEPIEKAIKAKYGDVEELVEERMKQAEIERGMMEAARKRAEEEQRKREARLEELAELTDEDIDKRYAEALEKDDEAAAREMLDEAARRKGYGDAESDYQGVGTWSAPSRPDYETDEARRNAVGEDSPDLNIEDMAAGYSNQPEDIFVHPEKYSQGLPTSKDSGKVIQTAIDDIRSGKKDVKIKVYRAVPTSVKEGKLRNGDWVTPNRDYAEMHGKNRLEGKYRIIEDEVPASELWWDSNDVNEWGYDNGKNYRYKNAKNNRKLNDLVTHDDKGNIIPPSKRFNSRKADERYQKVDSQMRADEREVALRDAVVDRMRDAGLDVSMDAEEGQRVLDEVNGKARMSAKKRRALETASVSREEKHQQTVISSADGAKVLKNLDNLASDYENSQHTKEKTFLGETAKALGANRQGSASKYATFETKNGKVITIRLSNHNTKVSNFDANGETEGISIVVSSKKSEGITNDGDAHVVEYFYDAIKLRRAEGKPLADIVRSIKQALYSGEFEDTTGLAERQEVNAGDVARYQKVFHGSGANHVRFFRTANGEAYGYTIGGKIYIDPRIANSETPIHEYAHLWATALRKGNEKEWQNVVELMKDTKVWDEVKKKYPELETESDIADEVLATYSGRRGAERLSKEMAGADGEAKSALERVKQALQKFWKGVADMLHIHYTSAEEVADRVMKDLLDGVDPRELSSNPIEGMERAAEAWREEQRLKLQKKNSEEDELFVSLQNKKGKEYYDTVTELARRIESRRNKSIRESESVEGNRGEHETESLPAIAGKILNAAYRESHGQARILVGRTSSRRGEKSVSLDSVYERIEEWAKRNNCYFRESDIEKNSYDGKVWNGGFESTVYRSKDGKSVIKVTDIGPALGDPISYYIDRNKYFNEVFPESSIEIVGYGRSKDGSPAIITKQQLVSGETVDAYFNGDKEKAFAYIDSYLDSIGFGERPKRPIERELDLDADGGNDKFSIFDLNPGNIIIDKDGKPHVIDCEVLPLDYTDNVGIHYRESSQSQQSASELHISRTIDKVSRQTGGKVKQVHSVEEIDNEQVRKDIEEGKEVTGWYDEKTGEVHLFMPNIHDSYTAEKTIWHETVGHKGMRGLLGEKFHTYLRSLWMDMDNPVFEELHKYVKERMAREPMSMYDAIEEFVAEAAEKGRGEAGFWNNVRNKVADALRSVGYRLCPNVKDVKYMLWLAKNVQKHPNDPVWKMRAEAAKWKIDHDKTEYTTTEGGEIRSVDGKPHDFESMTQAEWNEATDGQIHYRTSPSAATATDRYERMLSAHGYMATEAFADNMASVDRLMRALDPTIKKTEDVDAYMNPYMLRTVMDGTMSEKMQRFEADVMKPLDKYMARLIDAVDGKNDKEKIRNFNLYMIKKHGLERNRVFFVRDAVKNMKEAKRKQILADFNQERKDLGDQLRNGRLMLSQYYVKLDEWIRKNVNKNYNAGEHDYSGMHGMYGIDDKKSPYNDIQVQDEVMSVERAMEGMERGSVEKFWGQLKIATQFSLDEDYKNGFVTKANHESVSGMFDWYVPLRKFDEATAEDVYGYVTELGDSKTAIGPALVAAKGRKSLSETNILAQVGAMANYAIARGGQNKIKQAFALFVRNKGGQGLVTETKAWVEKIGTDVNGNDIWQEVFPDIKEGDTADAIAKKVEAFEQDMKQKEAQGLAKNLTDRGNVGFKFERKADKSQHYVDVMIAGKTHRFVINGNPRAAQALNGELENGAATDKVRRTMKSMTRFMAQMATSYNPEFVMRNAIRDAGFALQNVAAKEGARYAAVWAGYYGKMLPVGVRKLHFGDIKGSSGWGLYAKYRNGKLDMKNETEKWFKEFMENGGETGFVQIKNLQQWEKQYKRDILRERSLSAKTGKALKDFFIGNVECANEVVENMARFATYCASRHLKRSVQRSAYDAKQVSVNFNRHGSGDAISSFVTPEMGKGKQMRRDTYGFVAGYLRNYSMFFNAGVQGTQLMFSNLKKAPVATIGTMMATPFAFGLAAAMVNAWLISNEDEKERGGVKDPYSELPDYIRRNNLCIYLGKGKFVTIPLAIEHRAFYGLGDIAASLTTNPKLRNERNIVADVTGCLSQLFPVVDFMNSEQADKHFLQEMGKAALPTALSPFAEWFTNSDWKGAPIRRVTDYSENLPSWKNAYSSTPERLIALNKWANAMTNDVAPGNPNMKGSNFADAITDPSMLNHIIGTLGGGAITTTIRTANAIEKGKDTEWNEVPILRNFGYTPSDRTSLARTKSRWYNYVEAMNKTISNYDELGKKNVPVNERIANIAARFKFENSDEYRKVDIIKRTQKQLARMGKLRSRSDDDKAVTDGINRQMDLLIQDAVSRLEEVGK